MQGLSGSIIATADLVTGSDATGLTASSATDEYGNAADSSVGTGVLSYGWEGGAQREVSTASLALMAARLHDPTTARFSTVDPSAIGTVVGVIASWVGGIPGVVVKAIASIIILAGAASYWYYQQISWGRERGGGVIWEFNKYSGTEFFVTQ